MTGDGSYTYGITCSHSFSDGMFVLNNNITSSQYNIVIGDDYGCCNDYPLFQGNILIKSGSNPKYRTIANTYNTVDRHTQARFIDNEYQNGASEASISLLPNGSGLTSVYFGTKNDNEHKYQYLLHDKKGTSSTLVRDDFTPAASLNFRYPDYTTKPKIHPPTIKKISTS